MVLRLLLALALSIPALPSFAALADNMEGQWDINTRGRSDNDWYDHVNAVAESSTGSPSTTTGDGGYTGMVYDGSDDETDLTFPSGLSSTFANGAFTLAVRVVIDGSADFEFIFGAYASGSDRANILKNGDNYAEASVRNSSDGTDPAGSTDLSGTTEHVIVFRRTSTGTADFELWVDGSEVSSVSGSTTITSSTDMAIGGWGPNTDGFWELFEGEVYWAAVWDRSLSDAEIGELDDSENPFDSGGGGATIPVTLQQLHRAYGPQRSQQLGGLLQ